MGRVSPCRAHQFILAVNLERHVRSNLTTVNDYIFSNVNPSLESRVRTIKVKQSRCFYYQFILAVSLERHVCNKSISIDYLYLRIFFHFTFYI